MYLNQQILFSDLWLNLQGLTYLEKALILTLLLSIIQAMEFIKRILNNHFYFLNN